MRSAVPFACYLVLLCQAHASGPGLEVPSNNTVNVVDSILLGTDATLAYRIRHVETNKTLNADDADDHLLSTRFQTENSYSAFTVVKMDGTMWENENGAVEQAVRIRVVADNLMLHADDAKRGTHVVSTLYQPDDDYNHFIVVDLGNGTVNIKSKASGRFFHVMPDSSGETIPPHGKPPYPTKDIVYTEAASETSAIFKMEKMSVKPTPAPSPTPPNPAPSPTPKPPTPPTPSPTRIYVPASDPSIRYVGRFDHTKTGASFDRNGCEILFRTEGPVRTVTAKISQILSKRNQMTASKPHTFLVYVDGKPINKSIAGSECTQSCTFDTHGHPNATIIDYLFLSEMDLTPVGSPHDIRIMKTMEPEWGAKIPSPNWVTFHGLVLDTGKKSGGKITPPSTPRRQHRIEFIGDSITAGMCNLCDSGHPANWTMESFALSWPTVICETLGTECSSVAISGYGLVSNCCGKTGPVHMPEVWRRTVATRPTGGRNAWNFSNWAPDALVVNLGTNDFMEPRHHGNYVDAYIKLIREAHGYYGDGLNAFLACGPMMTAYCDAVHETIVNLTAMGIKAHFLDQTPFLNGTFGHKCCKHPSAGVDAAMGKYGAEFIAKTLGWKMQ